MLKHRLKSLNDFEQTSPHATFRQVVKLPKHFALELLMFRAALAMMCLTA
ncbi:hypothetical protein [Neisseria blantyrii]|nr:hypothetical protein [Neisseria blantyrii]